MFRSVFRKTLLDRSRSVIGWGAVLVALVAMYAGFYPALKDQAEQLNELISRYPEGLKAVFGMEDLSTPAGYLDTEFFSFMVPLFFIIIGIGFGGSATISEVEQRTIDLLMSNRVSRAKVLLQKYLAFAVGLGVVAFVLFLALIVGTSIVDMDIAADRLAAATTGALLLGYLFGAASLATAVSTGSKGITIGVNVSLALVAFVVETMSGVVNWLEAYRALSPFYHSGGYGPLAHGFRPLHAAVLLVPTVALVWLAARSFERRDLVS